MTIDTPHVTPPQQFQFDGAEVTGEVFESPASIVFDQAENRLHIITAVLIRAFGA